MYEIKSDQIKAKETVDQFEKMSNNGLQIDISGKNIIHDLVQSCSHCVEDKRSYWPVLIEDWYSVGRMCINESVRQFFDLSERRRMWQYDNC